MPASLRRHGRAKHLISNWNVMKTHAGQCFVGLVLIGWNGAASPGTAASGNGNVLLGVSCSPPATDDDRQISKVACDERLGGLLRH